MPTTRPSAIVGLLLLVTFAACGSDGAVSTTGTHLEVDGVATTTGGFVPPDSGGAAPPIGEPGQQTEVSIAGSLTCEGTESTGTGMFATTAVQLCLALPNERTALEEISAADENLACAEVYGGPQHASIEGSIDGQPIDIDVTRTDGCGIDTWTRLEWLLGPPER